MEENAQRKRNIAYRVSIGDLLKGKVNSYDGKFLFLELGEKKIVRVNIIANCVDKFIQDNEKKYASITIDDASGQIRLKAFGEDIEGFKEISQGDTLRVIGNIREWNGEIYLMPEIIKKIDPKWLLVRKLELQKMRKNMPSEDSGSIKKEILNKIRESEDDGGIDADEIIMQVNASPDVINLEIKKLLEEGLIYEPRPGRLRYLG